MPLAAPEQGLSKCAQLLKLLLCHCPAPILVLLLLEQQQ
jgi:hypothetical protein